MKIIFDARVLEKHTHGIARFCVQLLDQLLTLDLRNQYLVLTRFPWVKDWFQPLAQVNWRTIPIPPYTLREQTLIPWLLRKDPFDLYFSPTFAVPLALASRSILTIHDLIHLIFPRDYGWRVRWYYRLLVIPAVSRSRRVFTVSESSRRDILTHLGRPESGIEVTPNGLDPFWSPRPKDSEFLKQHGLSAGYLLFVGNSRPHKNFPRVLEAFGRLMREGGYPGKLVVVGLSLDRVPAELSGRLVVLPFCPDPELVQLYSGAQLLLAPSLYEGFGLPVLEAMACGCPVLISRTASLPEIAGPAGLQVDPYRVDAILNGLKQILADPVLRRQMIDSGLDQSRRYSWKATAQKVLQVFTELSRTTGHA
jgi:glycosyltransferase involved in cell wall biosynthesis